jgi:hypothetical protein
MPRLVPERLHLPIEDMLKPGGQPTDGADSSGLFQRGKQ